MIENPKNVELFQKPNLSLIVAVIASVLSLVVYHIPIVGFITILIGFGAWFTWSWLELFEGTNYVRRIIGGSVLVLLVVGAGICRSILFSAA